MSSKRLQKELLLLQKSPLEDTSISLASETDIHNWTVTIIGPKATPYQNGKFELSFCFPAEYPFKPPKIQFKTKIYHPNIKSLTGDGEICTSVINDDWGPTLNAKFCIETVQNILKCPSADNPLEEEIAALLRDKPAEFEKMAKKWTKDYAK